MKNKTFKAWAVVSLEEICDSTNYRQSAIKIDGNLIPIKRTPPLAIYFDELSAKLRMQEINDGPEHVTPVEITLKYKDPKSPRLA